ncbi:hypothetical protein EDD22DRAFT_1022103 [Suillus occidentalis]|nr:hypothetical protein EDD22DRAFT_1022103 [Suillus occidentalis]
MPRNLQEERESWSEVAHRPSRIPNLPELAPEWGSEWDGREIPSQYGGFSRNEWDGHGEAEATLVDPYWIMRSPSPVELFAPPCDAYGPIHSAFEPTYDLQPYEDTVRIDKDRLSLAVTIPLVSSYDIFSPLGQRKVVTQRKAPHGGRLLRARSEAYHVKMRIHDMDELPRLLRLCLCPNLSSLSTFDIKNPIKIKSPGPVTHVNLQYLNMHGRLFNDDDMGQGLFNAIRLDFYATQRIYTSSKEQ